MNYNIDFEICSLIFLIPFGIMGLSKKKIPNIQNFLFFHLTNFVIIGTALDILTISIITYSISLPIWLIYIVNCLYYIYEALVSLFFFLYILSLINIFKSFKISKIYYFFIPFLITVLLICSSPLTRFIFYIDENKIFQYGKLDFVQYVNYIIYFLFAFIAIFKHNNKVDKRTWIALITFNLIMSLALFIEYNNREYLLTNVAAGFGIIIVYTILQTPNHYVDKNTQLFNHNTVAPLITSLYEKKKNFHFIIFIIDEFKTLNTIFGVKCTEFLINKISKYLTDSYKNGHVLRLKTDQFGIIYFDEIQSKNSINTLHQFFPNIWEVNSLDIKITVSAIGLSSRDYSYPEYFLSNIDYAMSLSNIANNSIIYLDKKANEDIQYQFKVETILKKAIDYGTIEVYYQPIFNKEKNKFTNLEALARLYDSEIGYIPAPTFIKIAEQNGMIIKLGEIVLEKVCMLLKMNDIRSFGIEYVQINLSIVQCMQTNLYKNIFEIIDKYEIPYEMFCFEVTETSASTSFHNLFFNMNNIAKHGIKFALDDYGMGYSNIDYLMKLPFTFLKTDKNLLWSAMDNNRSEISFECIIYMAEKLGLTVISEGAETQTQLDFLTNKNINLIQGFYFSKPIPPDKLLEFLKKY
jgi:EAL domain-containing protein (putative c-di-GMP-specific phosphodiesterase class I)/GGDEF domain-containing protein